MKKTAIIMLCLLFLNGVCGYAATRPIYKECKYKEKITFSFSEFNSAFEDGDLAKIRFSVLPEKYQGELKLKGKKVKELQEINADDIEALSFKAAKGYTGSIVFLWNGAKTQKGFSGSASTVTLFIEQEKEKGYHEIIKNFLIFYKNLKNKIS